MTPVALLVFIAVVFLVLQQASPRLAARPLVFLGFNLGFVALIMPVPAMIWLGAYLAANYGLAAAARRFQGAPASVFILPAVLIFAVIKKYDFLPLSSLYANIPEIVGLSYIVFRGLIVIFEARDAGKLPDAVSYLNYCLSMFTFLSGPIQRYRAFSEDMAKRTDFRLGETEGAAALTRFMNGVIKIVYLSLLAQGAQNFFMLAQQKTVTFARRESITVVLHGPLEALGPMAPSFGFGMAALCYLFFLYFNFSGYTDMMIGLGRLFGFHLPENFDKPFTASSFLDFWKRWHASLSLWFRDYCFTPILKRMVKAGIKDPAIATLPAYFISFGLLGLWHGRTLPFILCGLMFATGSSANHFYRSVLNRQVAKGMLSKLDANRFYQAFAAAVTFFYISLAITGLWLSEDEFYKSWHSFSMDQAAVSFGLIVVILSFILYLVRTLWHKEKVQALMVRPIHDFFFRETSFLIAVKIFLVIVWYFVFSANLPDFVYEQF